MVSTGDAGFAARQFAVHLDRLETLARQAGAHGDATAKAVVLAELQQVGAQALREAVAHARRHGASWRELAAALQMPVTTLRRQYAPGDRMKAGRRRAPVPPAPDPRTEPTPAPAGSTDPADTWRSTVPVAATDQLVGRERELADLRPRLARHSLVTLTGPAGVGKTRLAVELVAQVRRSYRGGLWWVDLAPLPPKSPILDAVAAATAARDRPDRDLEHAIMAACANGPALLLLDNCEHVIESCADLATWLLPACPRLRILATSREALLVRGEAVFPIRPLPVPDLDSGVDVEVRAIDAVRLFVSRARQLVPDFTLTAELSGVVAQLCVRLDGLPLAIELAAHQVGMLPPGQLLQRLDERLTLLAGGSRHAPTRHRSLRAAIEWSYDLLPATERAVFRRLSVLAGSLDECSATAVCADLDLPADALWLALTELVGKSLLGPDPVESGRWRMLESLRAFGRERLVAEGELDATHARLFDWLSELARPVLTGMTAHSDTLFAVHRERHNLRYAVQVAADAADVADAADAAGGRYPRLAITFANYLRWRGELRQAQAVLEKLLAHLSDRSPEQARALIELAMALSAGGDHAGAERHAGESFVLARELDQPPLIVRALHALKTAISDVDPPAAIELCRREVEILRSFGQPREIAIALNGLGWSLLLGGRYEEAQAASDEALPLLEAAGDSSALAPALHTAGTAAMLGGQLDRATGCFSSALAKSVVDAGNLPFNLEGLALVAVRRHVPERALRLFAAAAAVRATTDATPEDWWSRLVQEAIAVVRGELKPARADGAWAAGAALAPDQAVAYAVHDEWTEHPKNHHDTALTRREQQVAELVAEGLTNPQIAARLRISTRTVASHLENIRAKLDLPTRAQVAAWAIRRDHR